MTKTPNSFAFGIRGENKANRMLSATPPAGMEFIGQNISTIPFSSLMPQIHEEQDRVTACQVVRQGDWFLMFYIGFRDERTHKLESVVRVTGSPTGNAIH